MYLCFALSRAPYGEKSIITCGSTGFLHNKEQT
jgi:hypothetical protein